MRTYRRLLVTSMCRAFRARRDLMLENLALRQQPAVYVRQSRRPQLHDADRRFWSLLARPWSGWRSALVIVGPDTVVRWHRAAWRVMEKVGMRSERVSRSHRKDPMPEHARIDVVYYGLLQEEWNQDDR